VWDVRGRKFLRAIPLPDDDAGPGVGAYRTGVRIALSGDGSRLAVGGLRHSVQVYDLSNLSATAKPAPAPAPSGPGDAAAVLRGPVRSTSGGPVSLPHARKSSRPPGALNPLRTADRRGMLSGMLNPHEAVGAERPGATRPGRRGALLWAVVGAALFLGVGGS